MFWCLACVSLLELRYQKSRMTAELLVTVTWPKRLTDRQRRGKIELLRQDKDLDRIAPPLVHSLIFDPGRCGQITANPLVFFTLVNSTITITGLCTQTTSTSASTSKLGPQVAFWLHISASVLAGPLQHRIQRRRCVGGLIARPHPNFNFNSNGVSTS